MFKCVQYNKGENSSVRNKGKNGVLKEKVILWKCGFGYFNKKMWCDGKEIKEDSILIFRQGTYSKLKENHL